ncbi:MAG: hypothetical protein MJZ68_00355 [archaeon]|nr:hypothetical protein [archaeon]
MLSDKTDKCKDSNPSRTFEVYYTDHGLRLVDNDRHIRILDLVADGIDTYYGIRKSMKIPRSSLTSAFKDLVDRNLLRRVDSPDDPMDIRYELISMKLVASMDKSDMSVMDLLPSLDDPRVDIFERWSIWNMVAATRLCGLSLRPVMEQVIYGIGQYGAYSRGTSNIDSAIFHLNEYLDHADMATISKVSDIPLKIMINLRIHVSKDTLDIFTRISASLICGYLSKLDGNHYRVTGTDYSRSDEDIITVRLEPTVKPYLPSINPVEDHRFDFTIYRIDTDFIPLDNKLKEVMDLVYGNRVTTKYLSSKLGKPHSTVSGLVQKLVDLGVVCYEVVGNHVFYCSRGTKVFEWNKPLDITEFGNSNLLSLIWADIGHSMRGQFDYFVYVLSGIGYDMGVLINNMVASFVNGLVKKHGGLSFEEFIGKMSSNAHRLFSSSLSVTSYSPFTVLHRLDYRVDASVSAFKRRMYDGFYNVLLEKFTGIRYKVSSSVLENNEYAASFVPDLG